MVYVGFSTTNAILSRFIRWVTKSEVSHTFLVFDLYGRAWVLEAGFFGVTMLPVDKFQKDNIIKTMAAIPEIGDEHIAKAMDDLGDRYDFGGLLGSAVVIVGRWFKRKWKNPWQDSKAMFCSEFVVTILQEAHFPDAELLEPSETTPQDLQDFLTRYYLNQG